MGYDSVVKLSTDIVVESYQDWHLSIWWKFALVRSEDCGDAFVVREVEGLVLLKRLCLSESVACHGGELLRLFVLI